MEFSPLLESAMRCAATWHRDQVRKLAAIPYITHPVSVVIILQQHGFQKETTLAAALLHDVLEDTDCTEQELAEQFPQEVVELVINLSEQKYDQAGHPRSWQIRKADHAKQMLHAPLQAQAVLLADKLHNLSSMHYDLKNGNEIWDQFGAAPDEILKHHKHLVQSVADGKPELATLAKACQQAIRGIESCL